MDAVEYLREKERMLADKSCQVTRRDMNDNEADYSELAVSLVEQWAKEHPIKTYKSEFLKLFPNVLLNKSGYPTMSVIYLTRKDEDWDSEFKGWS